jgi:leader peptidase (prepilin peptidase)/N-methyltransferase
MEAAAVLIAIWASAILSGPLLWASCVLGWMLLTLAVMDWQHRILADVLTLPLLVAGLAAAAFYAPSALGHHAVGAATGFAGFRLLGGLYHGLRGREGLGLGDAKFLAGAGAWVSWTGLPSVILLASVSALSVVALMGLVGRPVGRWQQIPFGPFLCLATWIVWLHGPLVPA